MCGLQIRIDTKDLAAAGTALQEMLRRMHSPAPMLDDIGDMLANSTRHRFETGRGPDAQPWKPSRRAQVQGGRTPAGQGDLRDSITHEVGASSVAIGSNRIYAAIHQGGGTPTAKAGGALRFQAAGQWVRVSIFQDCVAGAIGEGRP